MARQCGTESRAVAVKHKIAIAGQDEDRGGAYTNGTEGGGAGDSTRRTDDRYKSLNVVTSLPCVLESEEERVRHMRECVEIRCVNCESIWIVVERKLCVQCLLFQVWLIPLGSDIHGFTLSLSQLSNSGKKFEDEFLGRMRHQWSLLTGKTSF